MKTRSILRSGATLASATGLALISQAMADHKPGHQKDVHYSAGDRAVVNKAVCDSEKAKMTTSSSYSPSFSPSSMAPYIDEMERPVMKGTARGGGMDLVRNTKPMFNQDWSFMSRGGSDRDLAHTDSDRAMVDSSASGLGGHEYTGGNTSAFSTQSVTSDSRDLAKEQALRDATARSNQPDTDRTVADNPPTPEKVYGDSAQQPDIVSPITPPEAVGGTRAISGTQVVTESGRAYNGDREISNTQTNPNLDATIVVPDPDFQREKDLDKNREALSQDAQHGQDSDKLNRDRLLNRGQASVEAAAADVSTREARADADIAQSLATAIKADETFSADAKNIKITVENDTLTLRGTVASQTEKDNIERKAKQLAGIKQVKNQLQIKY